VYLPCLNIYLFLYDKGLKLFWESCRSPETKTVFYLCYKCRTWWFKRYCCKQSWSV